MSSPVRRGIYTNIIHRATTPMPATIMAANCHSSVPIDGPPYGPYSGRLLRVTELLYEPGSQSSPYFFLQRSFQWSMWVKQYASANSAQVSRYEKLS